VLQQAVGREVGTYRFFSTWAHDHFLISDALQNIKSKRLLVGTQPTVSRNISVNDVNGCGIDCRSSIPDGCKDPSICNHVNSAFRVHPPLYFKGYANVSGHYGVVSNCNQNRSVGVF
jgi:hypothetical protein